MILEIDDETISFKVLRLAVISPTLHRQWHMKYTIKSPSFVIFSGGSACNHIIRAFHESPGQDVSYVLGVSDNGGSTSELLRVLGGPSIGDLRSRLLKMMDLVSDQPCVERTAIKELLSYRLPSNIPDHLVKDEWTSIVEGRHTQKETIRGFLTLFNFEILKRAHKQFNFCNGSIGNFFLTGARLFLGSLEAAIFLLSAITGIQSDRASIVPVINTNHTVTIAALLADGGTLVGQCEISHPPNNPAPDTPGGRRKKYRTNPIDAFSCLSEEEEMYRMNVANTNLVFSKFADEKLESPIKRIFYMNDYGQEIYPIPNPKVISQLSTKETLVYSIGSLYTSVLPCLVLRHVGNAIAQSSSLKHKILLLNGSNDRETSDYSALDFISAITNGLNESKKIDCRRAFYQSCDEEPDLLLESPLVLPSSSYCSVSSSSSSNSTTSSCGTISPGCSPRQGSGSGSFEQAEYPPFPNHLFYPSPPSAFITHLVYLDNSTIPVDKIAIQKLGIQPICIRGTLSGTGEPVYDETAVSNIIRRIVHS
ncbi:hypothetical protein PHYBLDRAFT_188799 [Phycomyces blakesleeanus NRRL 1555(-)]|uniref:Uncharacterized protein n=1 Tax=Phycomyces blakesleeanus (strain ATCC 8743b / DSM 1359 / FGSC 10004 / NBRC 33097 / NRRL 1555) TaxID=763407 RepID=A0A167KGX5_PHYB8|nr:hypothetical protein PHYBLDRAFT_188799 [Phycomyces blakesleeanus NRRL 1555(-)]OAD68069.1 hypothetical protein PHYBLDRAFT_188799 [Phycomyces blakesleeanus NRRL 1555(-)]|eukprot:XP_018286109.1 hypothetical protein PHYBLDRAFT_188799 [Phycomyces blakesleeanus NRRL 1555(-)]